MKAVRTLLVLLMGTALCDCRGSQRERAREKKRRKDTAVEADGTLREDPASAAGGGMDLTVKDVLELEALPPAGSASEDAKFGGLTLAFVTPWNSKGYERAERFAGKMDWIAPCWLQLRRSPEGELFVGGLHDVDSDWMVRVKEKSGGKAKFAPRVVLETGLRGAEEVAWLGEESRRLAEEHGFGGVTLEMGWQGRSMGAIVELFGQASRDLPLFLVLPTPDFQSPQSTFQPEQLMPLLTKVEGAVIMTYDYFKVSRRAGAPMAPLPWVEDSAAALSRAARDAALGAELLGRILLGVPFYGFRGAEPALAHDLRSEDPDRLLRWDATIAEHAASAGAAGEQLRFPTPAFLAARLRVAEEHGLGLSIWEIGQGLDAFFTLL